MVSKCREMVLRYRPGKLAKARVPGFGHAFLQAQVPGLGKALPQGCENDVHSGARADFRTYVPFLQSAAGSFCDRSPGLVSRLSTMIYTSCANLRVFARYRNQAHAFFSSFYRPADPPLRLEPAGVVWGLGNLATHSVAQDCLREFFRVIFFFVRPTPPPPAALRAGCGLWVMSPPIPRHRPVFCVLPLLTPQFHRPPAPSLTGDVAVAR